MSSKVWSGRNRPIVATASRRALRQAETLIPGRPLENLCQDAFAADRVFVRGDELLAAIGPGVEAVCQRARTESGRVAWRPTGVRSSRRWT